MYFVVTWPKIAVAKNSRTNDKFTEVQFPVRLGEYGQLNDGLVGYWVEKKAADGSLVFSTEALDEQGYVVNTPYPLFYAPQSDYRDSQSIDARLDCLDDGPINFYQSLDDPAQTVTMLMDVQGCIHATVGILPNKTITIPTEQYTQALKNIEVSFLHAPILTTQGKTQLPLRPVTDYAWSWVEQVENTGEGASKGIVWDERFVEKRIEQVTFIEHYNQLVSDGRGEALWLHLLTQEVHWLATVDDDDDGIADTARAKVDNAVGSTDELPAT